MALCRKNKRRKTRGPNPLWQAYRFTNFKDNPYFHDLLDPFDTKKVIPFVELLPSAVENQIKPEEKNKETQDIVELEKNNKTTITTEEKETTELKEQPDEMADKETQKKILEQKIQFKKERVSHIDRGDCD